MKEGTLTEQEEEEHRAAGQEEERHRAGLDLWTVVR